MSLLLPEFKRLLTEKITLSSFSGSKDTRKGVNKIIMKTSVANSYVTSESGAHPEDIFYQVNY